MKVTTRSFRGASSAAMSAERSGEFTATGQYFESDENAAGGRVGADPGKLAAK